MPARARSDEHPDGLPDFEPSLRARVEAANTLYEATAKAVKGCVDAGKLVSVESPGRSYFWQTSKWCEYAQCLDLEETLFHHCQFSGDRNKLTRLAHNVPEFHQLAILCPGESASHRHKPWGFRNGAWATSEETAYPTELCRRMSELVAQALARVGMPVQHIPRDHRAAQAATAVQPTSKKLGPLVPEFKCVITVISRVPIPGLQSDKLSSACQLPQSAQSSGESTIPSGARVLRRFQARGVTTSQDPLEEVEEVDHPDSPNCGNSKSPVVHVDPAGPLHPLPDSANSFKLRNPQCHQSSSPADCELKHVYKVGIPWTADEFVHEACLQGHPKNYLGYVPDGLRECIESIASKTPSTRGANVAAELRKWVGRARALEVEEMDLKAKIPKHCKAILRKKRLCLFREMLVASGHEDISIVDDVKGGFAISGPIPAGNAFKPKRTSAVMTVGDLRGCASIVRKGTTISMPAPWRPRPKS